MATEDSSIIGEHIFEKEGLVAKPTFYYDAGRRRMNEHSPFVPDGHKIDSWLRSNTILPDRSLGNQEYQATIFDGTYLSTVYVRRMFHQPLADEGKYDVIVTIRYAPKTEQKDERIPGVPSGLQKILEDENFKIIKVNGIEQKK